jgi:hypothetical protein
MKKFIIFSLSLLTAFSSVPTFGMDGARPEDISHARWTGAKNGFYAGIFSGLGFGAITGTFGEAQSKPNARPSGIGGGALLGLIAIPVWSSGKEAFSQKLKERNANMVKADKKALKAEYHRAALVADIATTSAIATTAYATTASHSSEFGRTFCYALLPITAGITAFKLLTYGIWRNSDLSVKNYNQKKQAYDVWLRQQQAQPQAQQQPRNLPENDPKSS